MPPGQSRPCCICALQQHSLSGNASLNQPNRLDCGGARLSGNRSAARVDNFSSRYIRIFLMTIGSSMQAITFAVPPQMQHVSTSTTPKASTVGENPRQPLCPSHDRMTLNRDCSPWPSDLLTLPVNPSVRTQVISFSSQSIPIIYYRCEYR